MAISILKNKNMFLVCAGSIIIGLYIFVHIIVHWKEYNACCIIYTYIHSSLQNNITIRKKKNTVIKKHNNMVYDI